MGTRADFYVGLGASAEWLGSIAWDGYPEGVPDAVKQSETEEDYRRTVAEFLATRDDATLPERGWPWPWDDSQTTDYAYAFAEARVRASCFGGPLFDPMGPQPDQPSNKETSWPDMSASKNVRWDKGSGIIFVTSRE